MVEIMIAFTKVLTMANTMSILLYSNRKPSTYAYMVREPIIAAPKAPPNIAIKILRIIKSGKKVVSPLPGSIIKVAVTEGQAVKRGDLLLTLESMKMENQVLAEFDGTVTKIAVTAGQNVMQDDLLVVLG